MNSIERTEVLELLGATNIDGVSVEEEDVLSVQIAQALHTLSTLERHVIACDRDDDSDDSNDILPADEAERIQKAVEESYDRLSRPLESNWDYEGDDDEEYEREIYAIKKPLRNSWYRDYYERYSHPAEREEFRDWLDAYIKRYAEAALANTRLSDHPFEFVYSVDRTEGLRTAEKDLLLIQGCGAAAISALETAGTTVQMALPNVWHHDRIYSLRTAPEQWFGQIIVPNDIAQELGIMATMDS